MGSIGRYRYFVIFIFCGIATGITAQSPNFQWVRSVGGSLTDFGYANVVDAQGNVYSTGMFEGTADFDPSANVFNLTSNGERDIFVLKLGPSGNFIWAKSVGSGLKDYGYTISIDPFDNVLVAGYFGSIADFDPGPGTFTINANGIDDMYILKLDPNGNFIWAKTFVSGFNSWGCIKGIKTDLAGNIFTTGFFKGTVDFDPGAANFSLSSLIYREIFISKLDASGNFIWAKAMGGNLNDDSYSIALDQAGSIYTTGDFSSVADFDPGPGSYTLQASGGPNFFVSKYDVTGNIIWAKGFVGFTSEVTIDPFNNVYVTGSFSGTVDFDPDTAVNNLTSNGGIDIFVLKIDPSGNLIWVKNMGGLNDESAWGITTDGNGNVLTTGYYSGTGDFDPDIGTSYLVSDGGSGDIFISKLNSAGSFVWAKSMGGSLFDESYAISVDPFGNIYATGHFEGTADFDPEAGAINMTAQGSWDVFVLKMSDTFTSIEEVHDMDNFNVYPNPSVDLFTLEVSNEFTEIFYRIYNSLGVLIEGGKSTEKETSFRLTNEPDGIYFLKVFQNERFVGIQKLIKSGSN